MLKLPTISNRVRPKIVLSIKKLARLSTPVGFCPRLALHSNPGGKNPLLQKKKTRNSKKYYPRAQQQQQQQQQRRYFSTNLSAEIQAFSSNTNGNGNGSASAPIVQNSRPSSLLSSDFFYSILDSHPRVVHFIGIARAAIDRITGSDQLVSLKKKVEEQDALFRQAQADVNFLKNQLEKISKEKNALQEEINRALVISSPERMSEDDLKKHIQRVQRRNEMEQSEARHREGCQQAEKELLQKQDAYLTAVRNSFNYEHSMGEETKRIYIWINLLLALLNFFVFVVSYAARQSQKREYSGRLQELDALKQELVREKSKNEGRLGSEEDREMRRREREEFLALHQEQIDNLSQFYVGQQLEIESFKKGLEDRIHETNVEMMKKLESLALVGMASSAMEAKNENPAGEKSSVEIAVRVASEHPLLIAASLVTAYAIFLIGRFSK